MAVFSCVLKLLVLNLVLLPLSSGQDCGDDYLQPRGSLERLQNAEIVLFGRDVTPVTPCAGAPEACGRLEIIFDVDCVLKSGGITIRSQITIGKKKSSVDRCDVNIFSHGGRNTMIVMVKYNMTTDTFDWDSLPRQAAYFLVTPSQVTETTKGACGLIDWIGPRGGPNRCPPNVTGDDFKECGPGCRAPWFQSGDSCYRVTKDGSLTRQDATRTCTSADGVLAAFPKETDWLPVKAVLGRGGDMKWWLGGRYSDYDQSTSYNDWKVGVSKSPYILADKDGWDNTNNDNGRHGAVCQKNLKTHFPLVPSDWNTKMLELTFSTLPLRLYFCCNPANYKQEDISLSSTNLDINIPPGHTRVQPEVTVKNGDTQAFYTLIMADVSGHDISRGTQTTPYVHWLVTDLKIDGGKLDVTSGQTLFAYDPPKPISRDSVPHVVYLLRQGAQFGEIKDVDNEMSKFSQGNCLRCWFRLRVFKQVYELKMEDALWFRSAIDGWAAYTRVVKDHTSSPSVVCPRVWDNLTFSGENAICPWGDPSTSAILLSHVATTSLMFIITCFLIL